MAAAFLSQFNRPPQVAVRAPGRVDLMGSHTDYNEGCVLTLPIDRDTWIYATPSNDDRIDVTSLNLGSRCAFSVSSDTRVESWGQYIQGVARELVRAGYPVCGCRAVMHGTVPLSSGLSSSASLESAAATLFEQLGNFTIPPVEKARLCQRAENRWVGVNCGILDQYSSILGQQGKALLLDCRQLAHRYADFPQSLRPVICNTCAPRQLSGSEYGERRAQCEQAAAFFAHIEPGVQTLRDVSAELFEQHRSSLAVETAQRAQFIIDENRRVSELASALERDDRRAISHITAASFAGARDLFEISIPAMQAMFDAMRSGPGHIGSRQAGAGFGGCMVAIVEHDQLEPFCNSVQMAYEEATGIAPEIYPVEAAPGAGPIDL